MNAYKILILFATIISYIIIINFISTINIPLMETETNMTLQDSNEKVGLGDSVSISVHRKRFYGKIIQNGNNEYLYVLNFIKLPIKTNGINYKYSHGVFIFSSIMFILHAVKSELEIERRLYY